MSIEVTSPKAWNIIAQSSLEPRLNRTWKKWETWKKSLGNCRFFFSDVAVCQNRVPLVNIKIAGKWMFIPLKMVLIGINMKNMGNLKNIMGHSMSPLNITQPLGIGSIMATIRWCPIFPKWDSYQPLNMFGKLSFFFRCGDIGDVSGDILDTQKKLGYVKIEFNNWTEWQLAAWWLSHLHLWKMMDFVSWDDGIPNWMESHKIPWFQTTKQYQCPYNNICRSDQIWSNMAMDHYL